VRQILDTQGLYHDDTVALGEVGSGLVQPVLAPSGLAAPKPGDLLIGVALAPWRDGMGIARSLLVGELLAGSLALQPAKATLLTGWEQARHVQHLAGGKGHGMDYTSIHSDRWVKVRGNNDNGLLDPEADMPPEWVLDQAGSGKAPRVASRHSR
jgi:hypothetical protein